MMNYPLLSEYIEAIKLAEDNFDKLSNLRPVLDSNGQPVMSIGNFAVVFKMRDEQTGKLHAVKCFLKEQEGRDDAYRLITEELNKNVQKPNVCVNRVVKKRWTLDDFCSLHKKIRRITVFSKENSTGEDISYQFFCIPNEKDGDIIIEFSKELGILTDEEIKAKWFDLQVLLFQDGKYEISLSNIHYMLGGNSYLVTIKYFDKELFVDSKSTDENEFPILLMDWVDGIPLDKYINENNDNPRKLSLLALEFNRMAMWLINLPLAHGDLKPDNILVRNDGKLVLVDYDGMYVPAMKGQNARELGSPDFRHPSRTKNDFDEHIDDFPLVSILLSIKAISKNPKLMETYGATDHLLFSEMDYRDIAHSDVFKYFCLVKDENLNDLVRLFLFCLNNKDFRDLPLWYIFDNFFFDDNLQEHRMCSALDCNSPHFKWFNKGLYTSDYKKLVYYPYIRVSHELILHPNTEELSFGFEDIGHAVDSDSYYEWQWDSYPTTILYQSTPNVKFDLPNNTLLCVPKGATELFVNLGYERAIIVEGLVYIDQFGVVYSPNKKELLKFPYYGDLDYYRVIETCETIRDDAFRRYARYVGYEDVYYDGNCLKFIVLPESLRTIGKRAFYNCEFLESISIPQNVEYIDEDAFLGCTGLNSIIVDKRNCNYDSRNECNAIIESMSNTLLVGCKSTKIADGITTIGKGAFFDNRDLKRIIIPESILEIKDNAFYGCKNLLSVTIPDSTVSIGGRAFYKCEGLTNIRIGNNVINIGDKAFGECINLESITIPKSIQIIGTNILEKCDELTTIVVDEENKTYDSRESCNAIIETNTNTLVVGCSSTVIPNSVVNIGLFAFSECYGLKSLILPEGVEVIGDHAFENCYELKSMSLPNSLRMIGKDSFKNCYKLKAITIPINVTVIDDFAFYNCSQLETISLYYNITSIGNNILSHSYPTIHIPEGTKEKFFKLLPDYLHDKIVEDDTGSCKLLFLEENLSTEVTEEEIANGITDEFGVIYSNDGKRLLKGKEMDDYQIKEGVQIICDRAFSGRIYGVKSIHLPNSLIAIGNNAFELNSMQSLTIPRGVKFIGEAAFKQSVYLESVNIPDTVIHIGKEAFSNCFSLKFFKLPIGVSHIGDYTFSNCESLSSIFIPNSVKSIGNCVFNGCKSLYTINIPESVLTIGENPFRKSGVVMINCNSENYETDGYAIYDKGKRCLIGFYGKNVNIYIIPQTVEEIGEEAFVDNESLQKIVISKGCKIINIDAFAGCKKLTSISIPESVKKIGASAFCGCDSIINFSIPNSVLEIDNSAFSYCKNLVSIKLPNNITKICDYTFLNCYSLCSIVIPKSVRYIGASAFQNCQSIESIIVPENVLSIGNSAFEGCSSLQSLSILNNNIKIGDCIFCRCYSLHNANVPSWMKIETKDPLDDIIIFDYLDNKDKPIDNYDSDNPLLNDLDEYDTF